MANIEQHSPGSFCWIELGTTDQAAAKNFYTSLFGWGINDIPMGPGDFYSMFNLNGRNTGAAYTLRPDMLAHGVPPHWMLYIAVASADEAAAKIKAAGGRIEQEPMDVFDVGRMAVAQDPTGAMFCVWQAGTHKGLGIEHEPGTLSWADLMTRDAQAAKRFYEAVFGWRMTPGEKDPSGYLHIKNGEHFIGGVPPVENRDPKVPPHWLIYFHVTSCDQATTKAKQLGARVYREPVSMENVGRWSVVADPQGAVFALFEAQRHE